MGILHFHLAVAWQAIRPYQQAPEILPALFIADKTPTPRNYTFPVF
jgi:hypothetical protein